MVSSFSPVASEFAKRTILCEHARTTAFGCQKMADGFELDMPEQESQHRNPTRFQIIENSDRLHRRAIGLTRGSTNGGRFASSANNVVIIDRVGTSAKLKVTP